MPEVIYDKTGVFAGVVGAVVGAATSLAVTLPLCTATSIDERCKSIFFNMNMTNFQPISHACSKLQNHVISECELKTGFNIFIVGLFALVGAGVVPIVVDHVRACYHARKGSSYSTIT